LRETLYIRLRDSALDAATPFRVDGAAPGGTRVSRLGDVLDECAGRRVVVFVPGTDVRLSQAAVPARQASKALLAIPYALEDQLADDVETVHFALGARLAGDEWPVAAVSKARLEAWLEPFRTRGARIDLLLPDSLCLPLPGDGSWSVLMETELATVRSAAFGGFVCRPDDLLTYLDLADPERALGLQIITPRDVATDFSALGRSVDVVPEFGAALDALIRHHQAANAINLLQGDYAPASDMRRAWLPWRRAAVLAAACLLVLAIGGIVDLLRIGAAADAQVEANLQRFRQLFPGQTRVEAINLDSMIAAELRRLQGGDDTGLLFLMQRFAAGMNASKGLSLRGLQWRDNALYLNMTGTDLQTLETLRAWFEQQTDVAMEVESANAGSSGVQIRLKLTAVP
jgi:general secretion pathway protein L